MKKIKYLLYFVVLICLIVIVVSNWTFFSAMHSLSLNLYLPSYRWPFDLKLHKLMYQGPFVTMGLYFLGCFIIGFLISNFGNLVTRFKSNRQIKQLEVSNKALSTKLSDLQKEVDFLQRNASKPTPAPVKKPITAEDETTPAS